jgi:DNA-binding NarL/FixJ family response regulator
MSRVARLAEQSCVMHSTQFEEPDRALTLSPSLSPREREILQLAADGAPLRDIAGRLFLSPGTVKTHFQHIYAKLGVHDRAAAVAVALRRDLIR